MQWRIHKFCCVMGGLLYGTYFYINRSLKWRDSKLHTDLLATCESITELISIFLWRNTYNRVSIPSSIVLNQIWHKIKRNKQKESQHTLNHATRQQISDVKILCTIQQYHIIQNDLNMKHFRILPALIWAYIPSQWKCCACQCFMVNLHYRSNITNCTHQRNEKKIIYGKFIKQATASVVRVPGYRSRGPGFDSRRYQIFWKIVGLERGPLSLMRITGELLERIVAPPV
jgi:hypothetical protein